MKTLWLNAHIEAWWGMDRQIKITLMLYCIKSKIFPDAIKRKTSVQKYNSTELCEKNKPLN